MDGQVIEWNPYNNNGKVSDDSGTYPFSGGDCSSRLIKALGNGIPIDVTYDVAATGWAINLDLAEQINLAASAEPPKKKAVKALAKKTRKKSAGKKATAKKSKKQPRKSAAKKTKRR